MGGLVGGWVGFEVEIPPYTGVHTGGSRVSMASQNIYSFVYMCVCMCVCVHVCVRVGVWVCVGGLVGWWVCGWWRFHLTLVSTLVVAG